MVDYQRHPLSAKWPDMPGAELDALAADIKSNGQRQPAVLLDGMILDGWHRYLACIRVDSPLSVEPYTGPDPVAFVISLNRHRRHSTQSQLALAAAGCSEWAEVGKPIQSSTNNTAPGAVLAKTIPEVAKEIGVSTRTMERAKVVEANGSEELKEAVRKGDISLKKAEPIARKPREQQAKALADPPKFKPRPPADATEKLTSRIAELETELAKCQEALAEVIPSAESLQAFETNAEFIEMQILRGELRDSKRAEDTAKRDRTEMLKQSEYWKRRALKCEGKT